MIVFTLATLLIAATLAQGVPQPTAIAHARALYDAAAYEEALTVLKDAGPTPDRVWEVEQYRALCNLALGRLPEAERAAAAMIAAHPTYTPSPHLASPRVLAFFAAMRERELPVIAQQLIDAGRVAFERDDLVQARTKFTTLLSLLDDDRLRGRAESATMRALAQGFLTLAGPGPAAEPPGPDEGVFVPAVPIVQQMPAWQPPTRAAGAKRYSGVVRVRIGVDGHVLEAAIDQPSHPEYDARLLKAAAGWRYEPATRNGVPVESEKSLAVLLRATNGPTPR